MMVIADHARGIVANLLSAVSPLVLDARWRIRLRQRPLARPDRLDRLGRGVRRQRTGRRRRRHRPDRRHRRLADRRDRHRSVRHRTGCSSGWPRSICCRRVRPPMRLDGRATPAREDRHRPDTGRRRDPGRRSTHAHPRRLGGVRVRRRDRATTWSAWHRSPSRSCSPPTRSPGVPSASYRGDRQAARALDGHHRCRRVPRSARCTTPVVFWIALRLWGFSFWMGVPGAFALLAERSTTPTSAPVTPSRSWRSAASSARCSGVCSTRSRHRALGLVGGGISDDRRRSLLLYVEWRIHPDVLSRLRPS